MRASAFALLGIVLAAACARAPEHPDVVLVTIDTLRADRIGCYGDAAASTPVLDALARDGVRFARTSAATPVTLPSHATILTGRYPAAHGVRNNATFTLPPSEVTLAEAMRDAGFNTGAFVGSWILAGTFGLSQGFGRYDDRFEGTGAIAPPRGGHATERRAEGVTAAALAWSKAQPRGEPLFLWVHYYDPHASYQPPSPWIERFADRYRGEIAYTDHEIGRLLDGLRGARGSEPLVVVVADHGEAFGEHGEQQHGLFVYESTIHVPWIVSWRGRLPAGEVVEEAVTIADVAPTLLGLLGFRPFPAAQGLDLSESVRTGRPAPERSAILIENHLPHLEFGWSELVALRRGSSKYIRAPREELYALDDDPGEAKNLAPSRSDEAAASRARLEAIVAESERLASTEGRGPAPLDDEARASLQSLGYVGGSAPGARTQGGRDAAAADPKDRVEEFLLTKEATRLVALGDYASARGKVEALLARDPGNVWIRLQLAQIHVAMGEIDAAEAVYRGILATDERHCESLFRLGEIAMVSRRDLGAATTRFEAALACNPDDPRVLGRLAAIERSRGDAAASRRHLDRALALAPSDATLLGQLADAQAQAGEDAASRATWERVLDLEPRSTAALVGLATLDLRRRDVDAARERLERALAIDPDDAVANANLGAILVRDGKPEEAIGRLRAAVARDPALAPAWRALAEAYERTGRRAEADAARRHEAK